jgi:probable addiction module antidote protein
MEKLKTTPFDAARFLTSEEDIAQYLTIVIEENDSKALYEALNTVARARGMSEVATKSGLARESLYKALRSDSQPRFDTINRVLNALGVKLVAQPIGVGH